MSQTIKGWWAARSTRERRVVEAGAVIVLAVLLPLWGYLMARDYRAAAAADLVRAIALEADVARLREGGLDVPPGGDGSLQARAGVTAARVGLTLARVEVLGDMRARIVFEPADSIRVYQWIAVAGRQGLVVNSVSIMRVGGGDLVNAEFLVEGQ